MMNFDGYTLAALIAFCYLGYKQLMKFVKY